MNLSLRFSSGVEKNHHFWCHESTHGNKLSPLSCRVLGTPKFGNMRFASPVFFFFSPVLPIACHIFIEVKGGNYIYIHLCVYVCVCLQAACTVLCNSVRTCMHIFTYKHCSVDSAKIGQAWAWQWAYVFHVGAACGNKHNMIYLGQLPCIFTPAKAWIWIIEPLLRWYLSIVMLADDFLVTHVLLGEMVANHLYSYLLISTYQ